MSVTEYIFIFYSFILALAIAEIAQGLGGMLRRKSVKYSGLHLAWVGLITFSIVQFWWGSWALQSIERWSIYGMLVGFSSTFILYLAAFTSFPLDTEEDEVLEAYYFQESRTLWTLYALYLFSSVLARRLIFGSEWALNMQDFVMLIVILLCVFAAWSKRKLVHWPALAFFYISGIAITLVTQPVIGS